MKVQAPHALFLSDAETENVCPHVFVTVFSSQLPFGKKFETRRQCLAGVQGYRSSAKGKGALFFAFQPISIPAMACPPSQPRWGLASVLTLVSLD